jgi:hypothetical protein
LKGVGPRFKKPNRRRKKMDHEETNATNQINLRVETLILDEKIRSRLKLDDRAIQEYAEEMTQGTIFPPITVCSDGTSFWVIDGFHRVKAAEQAGKSEIPAQVTEGGYRKALLDSAGVNRTNGVRRTNEEKRYAVLKLLQDAEWKQWSDEVIAERCGVSAPFVGQLKKEVTPNYLESSQLRRGKDNRLYNTGKIGKRPRRKESDASENKLVEKAQPSAVQPEASGEDHHTTGPLIESPGSASHMQEDLTKMIQGYVSPVIDGANPTPVEKVNGNAGVVHESNQPERAEVPIEEESSDKEGKEASNDPEEQKDALPGSDGERTSRMVSSDGINDDIELLKRENQLLKKRIEELEQENAALKEDNEFLTGRVEHLEQIVNGCPD